MQLKIENFLYNQIKEIIEHRNNSWYLLKHKLEIISFIIVLARSSISICSYTFNFETFQYWRYDPLSYFLFVTFQNQFVLYTIIIMLPFLLGILGISAFYFQPVDTISYQIFYDLIVINFQQIKKCSISKKERDRIVQEYYGECLHKCETKFHCQYTSSLHFLLRRFCWHWVQFKFEYDKKTINCSKLAKYKLKTVPNNSIEFRLKIAKMIRCMERLFYVLHLILSIFNSKF